MRAKRPRASLSDFARFCEGLVLEDGRRMRVHRFQRTMLKDYFAGSRESLVLMPKKNGKSTLLAAVALHHLLRVDHASVAIVASSRDQAMILFEQARGFVQRTPWLAAEVKVLRGYREIRRRNPADEKEFTGLVKVYAADADTADGWIGTLALIDELHRHRSLELYGVLRDGLGPRQGRMVTISTAGESDESPLGQLRARAYEFEVTRNGGHRYVRENGFCMHEWALDMGDDLDDLRLVKTVNPAPWQTHARLRERQDSPSMTPAQWARFACGVWGAGLEPAFDREVWGRLEAPGRIEPGRLVVLGFDGARRRDSTVLVATDVLTGHQTVAGAWERPVEADEEWEVPEHEVDQAVDHAFEQWKVARMHADPPYWETAIDRWAGKHGSNVVLRWPTYRVKHFALALKAWQNAMRPGGMSHDGDALLTRHVINAVRRPTRMVDGDGEELWTIQKPSPKSERKIDGAVAACLAWDARGLALKAGAHRKRASPLVTF